MSGIEFRRAIEGDAKEILRVMAQAFGRAPDSERYEHDRENIARKIDEHWVLVREEEIVGAMHIKRDEIQVGRAIVAKAISPVALGRVSAILRAIRVDPVSTGIHRLRAAGINIAGRVHRPGELPG
jgi:N-acetylglutamate synthase-like GNAT family acetyltransferase